MFDELINLVKEHAGAAISDNAAIPNEHNDAVAGEASNSIIDGLKNAIANGNSADVTSLMNGDHTVQDSPVAQNIQGNFVQTLMSKFGLNESAATGAASTIIPTVLSKIAGGNGNGAGGFDLNGILSKFTGGNDLQNPAQPGTGGLMDELKNLL